MDKSKSKGGDQETLRRLAQNGEATRSSENSKGDWHASRDETERAV